MKDTTSDFRILLQNELAARCTSNPRYSLRAFAKHLGVGSSDLSKFIRRKRQLSETTLLRLANRLGLAPEKTEHYRQALSGVKTKSSEYHQVSMDQFHLVSDWYHFAILELIKVKGFRPEPAWVAHRLGISVSEVNIAVQRLMRLGYLEISARGKWLDKVGSTSTVNMEYTTLAKRLLQKQILEKAMQALEEVEFERRDQSAILMAVNSKNLPAARALAAKFRRDLSALLEKGNRKDQIYYLTVSLFPVLKSGGGVE